MMNFTPGANFNNLPPRSFVPKNQEAASINKNEDKETELTWRIVRNELDDKDFIYLRDTYKVGPGLKVFILDGITGDSKYRVGSPNGQTVMEWDEEYKNINKDLPLSQR